MRHFDLQFLRDDDEVIEFTCGHIDFQNDKGQFLVQKDYRVRGEVWRVHKGDADPYPSRPHAHCIDGRRFYAGTKLHLGTGELFRKSAPLGLYYPPKDFSRLCDLIAPKFPGLKLPLE